MKIAVQLYSLRDTLSEDLDGGLAKLAEIGFTAVEAAGTYGLSASDLRAKFDANGLKVISSHIGLDQLLNNFDESLADLRALGASYAVVPWISADQYGEHWVEIAVKLNEAGENLSNEGIELCYHNHDFELKQDGEIVPLDYLADHTDPAVVGFELDLAWLHIGGQNPTDWINRLAGNCPILHYKDVSADGKLVDVSTGVLKWDEIIAASNEAGVVYAIVENDNPVDAFQFAKTSFDFLVSKGLQS